MTFLAIAACYATSTISALGLLKKKLEEEKDEQFFVGGNNAF